MGTMSQQSVQHVYVRLSPTQDYQYEVSGSEIIRCRHGNGKLCRWTGEQNEMVQYLLAQPHEYSRAMQMLWQGRELEVVIYPAKSCWVIRRKDGSVYQCHPDYALTFARIRLAELERREKRETDAIADPRPLITRENR